MSYKICHQCHTTLLSILFQSTDWSVQGDNETTKNFLVGLGSGREENRLDKLGKYL